MAGRIWMMVVFFDAMAPLLKRVHTIGMMSVC
jgi:hypothetical protein